MATIRLTKILKELNVGIDRAVEILEKEGHSISNPRNAKITEEQRDLLMSEFGNKSDDELLDPEVLSRLDELNDEFSSDIAKIEPDNEIKLESEQGYNDYVQSEITLNEPNPEYSSLQTGNQFIQKIGLKNFRRFQELNSIEFNPITIFVGRNNSGKSTAVKAIQLMHYYLTKSDFTKLDLSALSGNYRNALNWQRVLHKSENPGKDFSISVGSFGSWLEATFTGEDDDSILETSELQIHTGPFRLTIRLVKQHAFITLMHDSSIDDPMDDVEIKRSKIASEIQRIETSINLKNQELKLVEVKKGVKKVDIDKEPDQVLIDKAHEMQGKLFEALFSSRSEIKRNLKGLIDDQKTIQEILSNLEVIWKEAKLAVAKRELNRNNLINSCNSFTEEMKDIKNSLRPYLSEYEDEHWQYERHEREMVVFNEFYEHIDQIEACAVSLEIALIRAGILDDEFEDNQTYTREKLVLTNDISSLKSKLKELRKNESKLKSSKSDEMSERQDFELSYDFDLAKLRDNSLVGLIEAMEEKNKADRKKHLTKGKERISNEEIAEHNFLRLTKDPLDSRIKRLLSSLEGSVVHNIGTHDNSQNVTLSIKGGTDPLAIAVHEFYGLKIKDDPSHEVNVFVRDWMKKLEVGENFEILSLEGEAYYLKIIEEDSEVHLADKGLGSIQAMLLILSLAVIIEKLRRSKKYNNALILIEEPEINLHPALQSQLTELFYSVNRNYGIQIIVETHSEYLIRESQYLVYQNSENEDYSSPFKVYYFRANPEEGPYEMEMDEEGKFVNEFETGFFDVARKQSRRML